MPPLRPHLALALLWACTVLPWPAPALAAHPSSPPSVELPDGSRYRGSLLHGKLHGQGRLDWGNGRVYEGDFAHGKLHGQGHLRMRDGSDYTGQFQRGYMHGQGRLRTADGLEYEGAFVQDRPHGKGRLRLHDGRVLHGLFDGLDDLPEHGAIVYPDGSRYDGSLAATLPQGRGRLRRADGSVLQANFDWGDAQGRGSIIYPDGSRYQGQLTDNQPDGRGRLTRPGHPTQTGHWRQGRYIGPQGDGTLPASADLTRRNNLAALYNQHDLLAAQASRLRPRQPGDASQMYALLIAGDGRQEVFRREVAHVEQLIARRLGAEGRSLRLVNSRSTVQELPLATESSIRLALQTLAAHMDTQRDYLLVYLTSHGSRDHTLELEQPGLSLPDLPARRLADLLRASGIRKQIVIVSACYSGGFIPALQGPQTWVITAARADRTSFGCAEHNDFTYFGRALFERALPQADTLSQAFQQASELVTQWEKTGGPPEHAAAASARNAPDDTPPAAATAQPAQARQPLPPSLPQSAVSNSFRAEVDAWMRQRKPAGGA